MKLEYICHILHVSIIHCCYSWNEILRIMPIVSFIRAHIQIGETFIHKFTRWHEAVSSSKTMEHCHNIFIYRHLLCYYFDKKCILLSYQYKMFRSFLIFLKYQASTIDVTRETTISFVQFFIKQKHLKNIEQYLLMICLSFTFLNFNNSIPISKPTILSY